MKQAKAKLDTISKSTAKLHPKVLVGELCVVLKYVLDELDRIKSPTLTVLPMKSPHEADVKRDPPPRPRTSPWVDPVLNPDRKDRKFNAGDAE